MNGPMLSIHVILVSLYSENHFAKTFVGNDASKAHKTAFQSNKNPSFVRTTKSRVGNQKKGTNPDSVI